MIYLSDICTFFSLSLASPISQRYSTKMPKSPSSHGIESRLQNKQNEDESSVVDELGLKNLVITAQPKSEFLDVDAGLSTDASDLLQMEDVDSTEMTRSLTDAISDAMRPVSSPVHRKQEPPSTLPLTTSASRTLRDSTWDDPSTTDTLEDVQHSKDNPNEEVGAEKTVPTEGNIVELIEYAYVNYGFITNNAIEKLRGKRRLSVVQGLEDTVTRNTLRSVGAECLLRQDELLALVHLVRGEQPIGGEDRELRHHSNSGGGAQHYHQDGGYSVPFNLFKTLIIEATLWGRAVDRVDQLSMSAFNLLDSSGRGGSHCISFRSVCWLLSILNKGDAARHLRLLYWLHLVYPPPLPPALVSSRCDQMDVVDTPGDTDQGDVTSRSKDSADLEEAEEAEDFFVAAEEETRRRKDELKRSLSSSPTTTPLSPNSSGKLFSSVRTPISGDTGRHYAGNIWGDPADAEEGVVRNDTYREYERRFLPPMTQKQFINLWRTVYAFFALDEREEVFGALARVGSLLLQTGDVCRQLRKRSGSTSPSRLTPVPHSQVDMVANSSEALGTTVADDATSSTKAGGKSGNMSPSLSKWSITFEQFLANVANENQLMSFFETKQIISEDVKAIAARGTINN